MLLLSLVKMMVDILYEDKYICICRKEPGMLSEMSESKDSLPKMLSEQIASDIFVLHRLDKPVGGAIMYAKTKSAASAFTKIIGENGVRKEYLTVVDGVPEEQSGTLTDLLFRDRQKNKTYVVKRMRKGVKEAKLNYDVITSQENRSLVKIQLITGRTHQIRAQFASRKMPVAGDGKYGSKDNKCKTALWSLRLEFKHPFTGKTIAVLCEPDHDSYPWNLFRTENIT